MEEKYTFNYQNLKFITIRVLNFFGYKYTIPIKPKNHLVKYIEYQTYLKNQKEIAKLPINHNFENNFHNKFNRKNIEFKS